MPVMLLIVTIMLVLGMRLAEQLVSSLGCLARRSYTYKVASKTLSQFYAEHPPATIISALSQEAPEASTLSIERLEKSIESQRDAQIDVLSRNMWSTYIMGKHQGRRMPLVQTRDARRSSELYILDTSVKAWDISSYTFNRFNELHYKNKLLADLLYVILCTYKYGVKERAKVQPLWPRLSAEIAGNPMGTVLTPAALIISGYAPQSDAVMTAKKNLFHELKEKGAEVAEAKNGKPVDADELEAWVDDFVLELSQQLFVFQNLIIEKDEME